MSNNKTKPTPLEILYEVSLQAAQDEVARRKSTPEDRDWSRALGMKLDARLAASREMSVAAGRAAQLANHHRLRPVALGRLHAEPLRCDAV
jgi:hypothetical protein